MKDGVCNYMSKYSYHEYNEALAAVPDDPSGLEEMHKDLKLAFKTGKTRDIDWRIG